jgi:hypothetical protein
VKIYHLGQPSESLNGCFTDPTGAGNKSTFGLAATTPTVGQRHSISPEESAILKSGNHGGIYRVARSKMEHAFHACPAQRQMQALRRDICSTRQLRCEMRNQSIINHA